MVENILMLHQFINYHGFSRDTHGRGTFQATACLDCAAYSLREHMTIRFSFFSNFEDQLVLEEIGGFASENALTRFKTAFGQWVFDNGEMRIIGHHQYQGDYTLSVIV